MTVIVMFVLQQASLNELLAYTLQFVYHAAAMCSYGYVVRM